MKKTNVYLLFYFMALAFVCITCKDEDDFDYNNITPVIYGEISGDEEVVASGASYEYSVTPRGGSVFTWAVEGADATVTPVQDTSYIANVIVPSSFDPDTLITISVTETTMGGIFSEPLELQVIVSAFCTFDIDNFTGRFTCSDTTEGEYYGDYSVNFTKDTTTENRIINDNFWDYPDDGETIYYDLSGDAYQTVTVPLQDFVFKDGMTGTVEGAGIYDACNSTMSVDYILLYGKDTNDVHHEFFLPD